MVSRLPLDFFLYLFRKKTFEDTWYRHFTDRMPFFSPSQWFGNIEVNYLE